MLRRYLVTLTLLLIAASSITAAYGHGLGTDTSLPATISNKQVSVEASLTPTFIDQVEGSSPRFVVRVLEEGTNTTIPNIDLRIAVELIGETLLDQRFRSSDGVVAANLVSDPEIDGWQINGNAPPDQTQVSQSSPVELRSKILTAGGLYHIAVTIERSSTGIVVDSDRTFDLYVSIGRSYTYDVQGGTQMTVKTYYDDVSNFDYSNGTISFEMPFTWDRVYVSQVPVLHMEVQFPKTIEELKTNSYRGMLNGRELEAQAIVIDDYSSDQNRIVHFVVNNAMLTRFAETMDDANVASFVLMPTEKPKFPLDIMSLPLERFLVQLSWGPDVIETGVPITFVMNIKDPTTDEVIRGSSFDFVVTQDGREVHRQHMSEELGLYSFQYIFPTAGTATVAIDGINGQGESAKIDLVVLQGSGETAPPPVQQPSGCLIATAAFGSELTPQVQYLRNFREQYILSTVSGSAFMNVFNSVYYSFSPQVADYEREQPWLQATVKAALYPLFGILTLSEKSYSIAKGEAGAMLAGATASSLIGAVYLVPAGYVANRKVRIEWLVFAVAAAAAIMLVTLVAAPALLSISTSVFVIAVAGASAITAAKAVRQAVHRLRN
ncbi:MAG: CFI-box-CTERM domain-containing protein [Thermoproteota archaeon]